MCWSLILTKLQACNLITREVFSPAQMFSCEFSERTPFYRGSPNDCFRKLFIFTHVCQMARFITVFYDKLQQLLKNST